MRSWTIGLSVVVHLVVFGLIQWQGRTPPMHHGTQVTVVSKPKKPAEPKPQDEAPKPPPPPPPRAPKVAQPAAPAPAPTPAPSTPAPSARPVATGLTMSNGPASPGGVAVGAVGNGSGPVGNAHTGDAPARLTPPQKKPEADPCDAPDTKPRPLGSVQVEYPDKARADGVEGRIQVRLHVADDGSVTDVEVVESIEPSLDATVIAVLRTWKFQPATHCGKPSAGVLAWAQRFELGD